MSAIAAGLSLLPLSVALFGFARAAPRLSASIGLRRMLVGGWLLFALGCLALWASLAEAQPAMRYVGLFAIGVGIALPYASAPRIAHNNLIRTFHRCRKPPERQTASAA